MTDWKYPVSPEVPSESLFCESLFFDKASTRLGACKKVQVGKDQEKAQSERFPLQKPRWEKAKLTLRHLYYETYRKPNEQLFSQ